MTELALEIQGFIASTNFESHFAAGDAVNDFGLISLNGGEPFAVDGHNQVTGLESRFFRGRTARNRCNLKLLGTISEKDATE